MKNTVRLPNDQKGKSSFQHEILIRNSGASLLGATLSTTAAVQRNVIIKLLLCKYSRYTQTRFDDAPHL